jgi:hypothetical protein
MTVDVTKQKRFKVMMQSTMSQSHNSLTAMNKNALAASPVRQPVKNQEDLLKSLFPVKDRPMFADEDLANLPTPKMSHSAINASQVAIETDSYSSSVSNPAMSTQEAAPTVWSELGQRVQHWWSHLLVPASQTSQSIQQDNMESKSTAYPLHQSNIQSQITELSMSTGPKVLEKRPACHYHLTQHSSHYTLG